MKLLTKKRAFNKITVITAVSMFLVMFLYYGTTFGYFQNLFFFVPTEGWPDKWEYMNSEFNYDYMMIWGALPMQFLLPIFSSLPVLRFIDEKRGFFDQLAIRYKSSFKFYIKTILKYALIAAATCFAGYMIYYVVGVVFFRISSELNVEVNGYREMFRDIVGNGLYRDHRYLFYFMEGIPKYILVPFVYGLFSLGISLWTNKKFMVIFIPTLYYLGFSALMMLLPDYDLRYYFAPSFIMAASSFNDLNTLMLPLALIIPFIISMILILARLCYGKEKSLT